MNMIRTGEWLSITFGSPVELSYESVSEQIPIPHKYWKKLMATNGIRMQGKRLSLHAFPLEYDKTPVQPEWGELSIRYEDDFCMVIDKPPGMAVHPAAAGQPHTLAAYVAGYYEQSGQACRIRHIHRLDANTSGLVLYAKNEWAHLWLDEEMRNKEIHRDYLALAEGRFQHLKGTITAPIGRDRHHAGKRRVHPQGEPAVTHYEVLEQFQQAAMVRLTLETGKTHQVRVHLSHIGHPLIGDKLYGGSDRQLDRQALHGYKLKFRHPLDRRWIEIESSLPEELRALTDRLRTSAKI